MSDLIDTTEMYLKTVYSLIEEGTPALRARIVERLGQSGPTVSETIARMERDGLVELDGRQIHFTAQGVNRAAHVMRRHRVAERLMNDVLKLDLERIHDEACRWEHVMSDDVVEKIERFLDSPTTDPFGNPIPDAQAHDPAELSGKAAGLLSLTQVMEGLGDGEKVRVKVARLGEVVQDDPEMIAMVTDLGILPGKELVVSAAQVRTDLGELIEFSPHVRHAVFVERVN
ncbi:iron dependent repressor, metal binding and dimerization domain protein [Arcanobacterium wilhelmae]|uniref:metal-dependent transcriptional regulator n=1 Tax=Arcanobacterium wilhelmae TaxID=1803177 RepID=UPI0024154D5D|nr:metal-dependent transcriptional regulator [Arcanobacterium wilhelmae]WFN90519.1 iron dependent repressor, metal binding and dimerization domain protein [Arcanobacterium wilhelmae]